MTWNAFKEYVDKELISKGGNGNEEIWYIDISFPDISHEATAPQVNPQDDDLGITII